MKKRIQSNKGFSLIELLIAMTIFSIIMVMVVTFMSTTTAAYRKTQKNVGIQTEALQISEQISDVLMQAKYIRVTTQDGFGYILEADSKIKGPNGRKFEQISGGSAATEYPSPTDGASAEVYMERLKRLDAAFNIYNAGFASDSFVPDNYPNYVLQKSTPASSTPSSERKIILDYSKFRMVNEKGVAYPISGDAETDDVLSFRLLQPIDDWKNVYIKPKYIYVEYYGKEGGTQREYHTIYYVSPDNPDPSGDTDAYQHDIYMYREEASGTRGFNEAKAEVDSLVGNNKGRLTKHIDDFYLSADVDGNTILTNYMFSDAGYSYNENNAVRLRNSNVLTVKPQKLFKKKEKLSLPSSTPGSPSTTPSTTP